MIFGPPNQEPRLEDLSLLLGHTCDPQNLHVRSAPTTLTAQPTPLQGHTYDPETRMSGAHLRPSQLHLRPFKVTPTTLKPACQEPAYDLHSSTYDPSRSHLRPSNLHVRKPRRPFSHFGRIQRYSPKRVEGRREQHRSFREAVLALYGVHIAKAQNVANVFLSNCALELRFLLLLS